MAANTALNANQSINQSLINSFILSVKGLMTLHWIFFQSYCQAFGAKLAEPKTTQESHFLSVLTYPVGGNSNSTHKQ